MLENDHLLRVDRDRLETVAPVVEAGGGAAMTIRPVHYAEQAAPATASTRPRLFVASANAVVAAWPDVVRLTDPASYESPRAVPAVRGIAWTASIADDALNPIFGALRAPIDPKSRSNALFTLALALLLACPNWRRRQRVIRW